MISVLTLRWRSTHRTHSRSPREPSSAAAWLSFSFASASCCAFSASAASRSSCARFAASCSAFSFAAFSASALLRNAACSWAANLAASSSFRRFSAATRCACSSAAFFSAFRIAASTSYYQHRHNTPHLPQLPLTRCKQLRTVLLLLLLPHRQSLHHLPQLLIGRITLSPLRCPLFSSRPLLQLSQPRPPLAGHTVSLPPRLGLCRLDPLCVLGRLLTQEIIHRRLPPPPAGTCRRQLGTRPRHARCRRWCPRLAFPPAVSRYEPEPTATSSGLCSARACLTCHRPRPPSCPSCPTLTTRRESRQCSGTAWTCGA